MSQRGVISKTAQEFVWKYVRRAAGKAEVQRYLARGAQRERGAGDGLEVVPLCISSSLHVIKPYE